MKEDVEAADKSSIDTLEINEEKSNTKRRVTMKMDPGSKIRMNSKEITKSYESHYDDTHTRHDKSFVTLGKKMSENRHKDVNDLINIRANDNS